MPLTGFGYCLANGVKKAVAENGLFGAISGGLTGAAGGITVAIIMGVICAVIFKAKR